MSIESAIASVVGVVVGSLAGLGIIASIENLVPEKFKGRVALGIIIALVLVIFVLKLVE